MPIDHVYFSSDALHLGCHISNSTILLREIEIIFNPNVESWIFFLNPNILKSKKCLRFKIASHVALNQISITFTGDKGVMT